MSEVQPVLLNGQWTASAGTKTFQAMNPNSRAILSPKFPVSPWSEIDQCLKHAQQAFETVRHWPGARFAAFLEELANEIDRNATALVEMAYQETGLPVAPRLKDVELPRTTNQLRQAAQAAREGSWTMPTIDTKNNLRSILSSIGPVAAFGPNNFPFAYNGIGGGDFAAAVAAGNPVIGKAHSSHPETSRLMAEAARKAAINTEMPPGFVQMIYRTSHEDGTRWAQHHLLAGIGYTGGRSAGLVLKKAADAVGKPIYLELSSINPVVILPGALKERPTEILDQFTGSCLMGAGQFCTSPGLIFLIDSAESQAFIQAAKQKIESSPAGTLLSEGVLENLSHGVKTLIDAGAELLCGGSPGDKERVCYQNTFLKVNAQKFLSKPDLLQTEAFGNASLVVVAWSQHELFDCLRQLEGNLTGSIYSATSGADDEAYVLVEPLLRTKVGRLLNDKMPTGVAVSPAMNHGGPFPATGHAGFTAVGIPAAIRRFAALHCYDNVRPTRLPALLQNENPGGTAWRSIDGVWTKGNVG